MHIHIYSECITGGWEEGKGFASCVTLGKIDFLSQFSHLQNGNTYHMTGAAQVVLVVKEKTKNLPANAGDQKDSDSIPAGSGRSPGGGHGNPLQYSCLENPMEEEPGGLQSMGPQRVGHNYSNLTRTLQDTCSESQRRQ